MFALHGVKLYVPPSAPINPDRLSRGELRKKWNRTHRRNKHSANLPQGRNGLPLDGEVKDPVLVDGEVQDPVLVDGEAQDPALLDGEAQTTVVLDGEAQSTTLLEGLHVPNYHSYVLNGIVQEIEQSPKGDDA